MFDDLGKLNLETDYDVEGHRTDWRVVGRDLGFLL